MSGSVGTTRAGSHRHTGPKEKMAKERNVSHQQQQQQQQQIIGKNEAQANKMQPTQEQLRLAQMMNTSQSDADPSTVKELMAMTGKSEDDVVIALHDAENDADRAVIMLLEGGDDQQGEWREQGGKRKKKGNTSSQKDGLNHVGDEYFEGRNKDRDDKERDGNDRQDPPPRRGRRNGAPPPRLARGRGRDRGNFADRDNRDRINVDDWDNDGGDERRDRNGADRGRSRGRGGFSGRRGGAPGGGRGRYNNSNDRENRSYNRVPRFEKMNNQQLDGPEIDTWTNETAEINKDTDWDNWNDKWVNEEDQWTGTLEETKVFTPSQMKIPEPEPVMNEPPSSLGQRLDVGSLFIESAKFTKAPDYSKPSGDAYITQFNQAATESIKNTIGIGNSSRAPPSISMAMPQQSAPNSLGLSSLAQSSGQVPDTVSVLSALTQQSSQAASMAQTMTQLSQFSQSPALSQMGLGSKQQNQMTGITTQQQNSREQASLSQSRIPAVVQQQNLVPQTGINNSLQQRSKPQRTKQPPPSKIPATAVEMPGHIPRNTQLDLQFGIDFGSDSSPSFGFVGGNGENTTATSAYSSTSDGSSSVISNHLNQSLVSKSSTDGNSIVSNIMSSPSAGSNKVPSNMEPQQSSRPPTVFHNSVYTTSPPKNESQSLDREQNKMSGSESIPFPTSQLERKSSPMMTSQRPGQSNQNLSSGSIPSNKNDTSNIGNNYSAANGYSSYQSHQKASSIPQTQSYTHTTNSQPPQGSSFPGQYPASQGGYTPSGQGQYPAPPSATQFPPSGQPPQFNNAQTPYSSSPNQFASGGSPNQHSSMAHANHQSQYSSGSQNAYSSGGQAPYPGYQNNASFSSHSSSQSNFPSSNQTGGQNSSLYPVSTQSNGSSYSSPSNTYQSPSAGSYHSRDSQTGVTVSTQSSSAVAFPTAPQSSSLKPSTSQTSSNYSSQSFNTSPVPLQPSSLANKLGESLSKMTLKDTSSLDAHQQSQYEHSSTSSTTVSSSLSLPSATSTASLSTGTTTISSTSTATSITSTSRIASMPSTSKAPPNLPPGVPLMGQYIMGQSTIPPFYSMQPPMYGGYDEMQLLQQRMPLQHGSYYDMSAFPAPAGTTLPTGRDPQPPIANVPFSGTSADTSKMPRLDAQSPNSATQPQNAHSTAQPSLIYGYYYPSSMFPGTAGLQYPMYPMPPVTNAAAHAGTTATTQFQKSFPSHVYTTKGYDELNQAQDFSKTGYGSSQSSGKTSGTRAGTSEITPNAYNKTHTPAYDKQGFHGGTPPPFNLPLASATQAGPLGGPTAPYGAPFLPVMAAHQAAQSQMMHHPIQQDSGSSSSRGLNQSGNQAKTGTAKSYGGPPYWNS